MAVGIMSMNMGINQTFVDNRTCGTEVPSGHLQRVSIHSVLRKEVIQPQVPLRLPCYDFTPVADLTVVGCLPFGLAHRLRVKPTPMV